MSTESTDLNNVSIIHYFFDICQVTCQSRESVIEIALRDSVLARLRRGRRFVIKQFHRLRGLIRPHKQTYALYVL